MTDLLSPQAAPSWRDHLVSLKTWCTVPRSLAAAAAVALAIGAGVVFLRPPSPPVPLVLPRAGESAPAAGAATSKGSGASTVSHPAGASYSGNVTLGTQAPGDGGMPAAVVVVVTVHAAGRVVAPGVYSLRDGARVADVITAAGGLAADADGDRLNLAARVVDGQRVYVARRGEVVPPEVAALDGGPGATGAAVSAGGKAGSATPTAPIDLNTATAEQLDSLPGVGPATASAIVTYRDRNGRFRSVAELLDVPGIGPSKLEAIRPLVRV